MARCSLLEFNETRNDSERESFLSKILLDNLLLNRLIVSVFWCSRKLFAAFHLRSIALVVHLQVF